MNDVQKPHYYVCSYCGVTTHQRPDVRFARITEDQAREWNPNVKRRKRYDICHLHFTKEEFQKIGRSHRLSNEAIPRPQPAENADVPLDPVEANMVEVDEMEVEELDEEMVDNEMVGGVQDEEDVQDVDDENFDDVTDYEEGSSEDDENDGDSSNYQTEEDSEAESRHEYGSSDEEENELINPAQGDEVETAENVEAEDEQPEEEELQLNDLMVREINIMKMNPKFYLGIVPEYFGILGEPFNNAGTLRVFSCV